MEKNLFKPRTVKARKRSLFPESKLQCSCVLWFDLTYRTKFNTKLLFAIPNDGKRTKGEGDNARKRGMRAGILDMMLAIARKGYHGMFIEMKFGKGKTSEFQDEMIEEFKNQGYKVVICYTFEEFEKEITEYLN